MSPFLRHLASVAAFRGPGFLGAAFLVAILTGADAAEAGAQEALGPLMDEARILFDTRLRSEFVDQTGFEERADALTLRTRFGFETGFVRGLGILLEGDFTTDVGVNDFNSTVNGKTRFPVVADPSSERLNRFHLTFRAPPGSVPGGPRLLVGRQRIVLDDARFVGNVGFRQNEQTFDAVRLTAEPGEGLTVDYAFVWQVNRILGSRSPHGRVDADAHLLRGAYELPVGTLSAHAYLVELDESLLGASNQTYGARFAGERSFRDIWRADYTAAFSTQRSHGRNPDSFSLDYWLVEAGIGREALTASAAVEVLDGDGDRGFATPLATLHAFQGFADVFLTTPPRGIRDLRLGLDYVSADLLPFGSLRLSARHHDFSARRGAGDLGREIDLGLFLIPAEGITFSVEYADFSGVDDLPDLRKVWVALEARR